MATNDYKILTRKNYILKGGIKTVVDENTIIPFDNMLLETSGQDDPSRIIIPTMDRTLEIIKELKEVSANVLYKADIVFEDVLPDADILNQLYNSTAPDEALFVQDIISNNDVALSSVVKKVTVTNSDGTTQTFDCVKANLNEGILYTVKSNGIFETAVFTASGWQLDRSKNTVPAKIDSINGEIANLKTKDLSTDSDIASINARLSENGVFLTQANVKSVSGKGTIALSGTPTDWDKLPIRSEVGSMGAILQTNINTATQAASSAQAAATAAQSIAQTAANTVSGFNNRITDAERLATSAHDAVTNLTALEAKVQANSDAIGADATTGLRKDIADLKSADGTLQANIDANTALINGKANTSALNAEITARTTADTTLQTNIDTLKSNINTELAKKALATDLTAETTSRKSEITRVEGLVTAANGKISQNTSDITAIKTEIGTDALPLSATTIREALNSVYNHAHSALIYGRDWNSEKLQLVRRDEIQTKAAVQAYGRPIVRVGTTGDTYEVVLNTQYTDATNVVRQPMDFSGVTGNPRAIAGFTRTFTLDGTEVLRANSIVDTHFDDTATGTDEFYLADSTTTQEKIGHTVNITIKHDKITLTFPNQLTNGQREVLLQYRLYGIEFESEQASSLTATDQGARTGVEEAKQGVAQVNNAVAATQQDLETLKSIVTSNSSNINLKANKSINVIKYNTTTSANVTTTLGALTDADNLVDKTYVDSKLSAASDTTARADIDAIKGALVQKNTTDVSEKLSVFYTAGETLAGKTYVDEKFAAAVPATLTSDLTTLKDIHVKLGTALPNGTTVTKLIDLPDTKQLADKDYVDLKISSAAPSDYAETKNKVTALEGIKTILNDTAAGVGTLTGVSTTNPLAQKSYVDGKLTGMQPSSFPAGTTIAGQSTVQGALTSINANVALMTTDVTQLKTDVANKQNSTDNSLTTVSKTISGAINELKTSTTNMLTDVNSVVAKTNIDNTKLLELKTALGL